MASPPSTGNSPTTIPGLFDQQKRHASTLPKSISRNMTDPFLDTSVATADPLSVLTTSKRVNSGAHPSIAMPEGVRKESTKMTTKKSNKDFDKDFVKENSKDNAKDSGRALTDALLARLSEQKENLEKQNQALKRSSGDANFYKRTLGDSTASSSVPVTPGVEGFPITGPTTRSASANGPASDGEKNIDQAASDEIARLKAELAKAHTQINRLDTELHQMGSASEAGKAPIPTGPSSATFRRSDAAEQMTPLDGSFPRMSGSSYREYGWSGYPDNSPDSVDMNMGNNVSMGRPRSRGPWASSKQVWQGNIVSPMPEPLPATSSWFGGSRGFSQGYMDPSGSYSMVDGPRGDRLAPDSDMLMRPPKGRRGYDSRYASPHPYGNGNGYGGYSPAPGPMDALSEPPVGMGPAYSAYSQQPVGTALSPHASEFQSTTAWGKNEAMVTAEGQTYLPATEPLNYRRLLDRNVNCDWKYIVDKIVCNNDQQASIFLQQKLKVGTPEQKYDIVEAIIAQAYPLMVNRFGNFLVQRCFEHGTPEQVVKIAEAIRGNTLNLSMDPFGCHVVQKAFDSVPEAYKAIMVHELLRRIPETVIHRYACHVWQKLFELRWSETPPQIMTFVNDALRGMWHEVALGETGSLVVQNIFENCLEDDKRPCIEEVLANIDIVAHGQFGNWCIQHICEHGAPADRSRAIDHVIRYAAEYSTDQFASKVVEKCLKVGGPEFLGRYLDRVCEGRPDRPRIPLIDIASDQYGNYLIQYILTHANTQHREIVAAHIRKHMVSLRGSKFGSRVGMLCTNPAVATRPGPGVGPGMSRMGNSAPRRPW
ncbi:armadillo-type protein [Plectosphaerella cucumerina]|uniref:Armadillo-type protein n=1 Tax=Plectosphaerella cucumerina TaxID=40658 RepID=A0A8K0WZX7_9PEZI|nr:armadillo-type protein [Plectosphaerella cucumerina]